MARLFFKLQMDIEEFHAKQGEVMQIVEQMDAAVTSIKAAFASAGIDLDVLEDEVGE